MDEDIMVEDNGKMRKAADIEVAETALKLRQKGDPWEVIDFLIKVWSERSPEETQAVKVDIQDQRELLDDPEFGTTKGGKDFDRRFVILFPTTLSLMIRTMYKAEELPFDSKFYKEFGKRYPAFRVAEKN